MNRTNAVDTRYLYRMSIAVYDRERAHGTLYDFGWVDRISDTTDVDYSAQTAAPLMYWYTPY